MVLSIATSQPREATVNRAGRAEAEGRSEIVSVSNFTYTHELD